LWQKISLQLNNTTKVLSIDSPAGRKGMSFKYWRMSVAACGTIFIIATVLWMNTKETTAAETASNIENKTTNTKPSANSIIKDSINKSVSNTDLANNKKEAIKKDATSSVTTTLQKLTNAPVVRETTQATNTIIDRDNNLASTVAGAINIGNRPLNNYLTITGPNGEKIKVSSKFSKLVNYLKEKDPSREDYLENVIKEGAFWKEKFKEWGDKMTNNNLAPTPGNFFDIIELSNTIKEN